MGPILGPAQECAPPTPLQSAVAKCTNLASMRLASLPSARLRPSSCRRQPPSPGHHPVDSVRECFQLAVRHRARHGSHLDREKAAESAALLRGLPGHDLRAGALEKRLRLGLESKLPERVAPLVERDPLPGQAATQIDYPEPVHDELRQLERAARERRRLLRNARVELLHHRRARAAGHDHRALPFPALPFPEHFHGRGAPSGTLRPFGRRCRPADRSTSGRSESPLRSPGDGEGAPRPPPPRRSSGPQGR